MNKYEKMLKEEPSKRETVLKILELLNDESIDDAKELLDIVKYYLGANCYFDYELARGQINFAAGE